MDQTTVSTNPPAYIFKAYDIRGIVGQGLDDGVARQIGLALGSKARSLGQRHFFVGRDGRLSSPALQQALIKGLLATGCDVTDLGCLATPVVYFAAAHLGTGNCVMVTGSHNPPDYNGFKMIVGGETLSPAQIQRLRQRIEQQDYQTGAGSLDQQPIIPAYIDYITQQIRLARSFKVVVDCGNGAAGVVAPPLLRALGCEVIELYCEVDGRFPHHHPDPSQPANLQALIGAVRDHQADLGLAFDGDGDRLGVIAPDGRIIWPDLQMILYAEEILQRHPRARIIFDVKSSAHLARRIEAAGGQPVMWNSGYTLIKARLKELNGHLAGEMSGHVIFNDRWFGFDDALYTAARLLELLDQRGCAPQQTFDTLPHACNTPELFLKMQEGEPFALMERLYAIAHFEDCAIIKLDGLRVEFPHGWGLVRASNTTPCLSFRFEGDDEAALYEIQARFRRLLWAVEPTLNLPF
ncbi:MAG: phosphomannomutase/phosphoglucomutase [Pseudomonadota bacterium]